MFAFALDLDNYGTFTHAVRETRDEEQQRKKYAEKTKAKRLACEREREEITIREKKKKKKGPHQQERHLTESKSKLNGLIVVRQSKNNKITIEVLHATDSSPTKQEQQNNN